MGRTVSGPDADVVVVDFENTYDQTSGMLLYSGGAFTALTVPGLSSPYAFGINNKNQVVGYASVHGFVLSGSSVTIVDHPRATSTHLLGINNGGQVVGYYYDQSGISHGFMASPPGLAVGCTPTTGPTQVGTAYSATCTASGGTAPYAWTILPNGTGSLPLGLGFAANGATATISGTPTKAGNYNYRVEVTDSTTPTHQTAQQTYGGDIVPIPGTCVNRYDFDRKFPEKIALRILARSA